MFEKAEWKSPCLETAGHFFDSPALSSNAQSDSHREGCLPAKVMVREMPA